MTTTSSLTVAAMFALGLAVPAFAAEDIIQHDTYEKRSMKVETGVVAAAPTTTVPPSRTFEHHEESESNTVERHSAVPAAPAAVVRERTTDSVETHEKN